MSDKIKVQDTAFMTSSFRASNSELSKDKFAELWSTTHSQHWGQRYAERVSKYEPYAHCLRNRFFYETLNGLINAEKIDTIINFGCGYSMYPYLLPEHIKHIEIDKKSVVKHKQSQTDEWIADDILPERDVTRIGVNFSKPYEDKLRKKLEALTENSKTFILLEGVLFFLDIDAANRLFEFFETIQKKDDYIGSVSFQTPLAETEVFKKMLEFSTGHANRDFNHLALDDSYYRNLANYTLENREDFYTLASTYDNKNLIAEQKQILNEQMYLLRKS